MNISIVNEISEPESKKIRNRSGAWSSPFLNFVLRTTLLLHHLAALIVNAEEAVRRHR